MLFKRISKKGKTLSSWLYLVLGIMFEVSGTTFMKFSVGFTKPLPSILIFVFYAMSLISVTIALKKLDIGIAYAVWSGVGTMIISMVGILFFRESISLIKIISMVLIIAGVISLNLTSN
ncbi:MAG: QacE family quaternary ammonium compound efflux SMR transporter [Nodularia sp. (in: Bacteria)]|nr:MAG: QacE family quaternary ammonium compound efflux SMR transporter [Nodularia sp. (in: cyanobacteria)]